MAEIKKEGKNRMINTRIWIDDYFVDLSGNEKLVWLYLLTNTYTHICGIYQLPLQFISNEVGINRKEVEIIIEKFIKDKKVKYKNGWIALKNFIKHQNLSGKSVMDGVTMGFNNSPADLVNWVKASMVMVEGGGEGVGRVGGRVIGGCQTIINNKVLSSNSKEKKRGRGITTGTSKTAPPTFSESVMYFKTAYKKQHGKELLLGDLEAGDIDAIAVQAQEHFKPIVDLFLKNGGDELKEFKKYKQNLLSELLNTAIEKEPAKYKLIFPEDKK